MCEFSGHLLLIQGRRSESVDRGASETMISMIQQKIKNDSIQFCQCLGYGTIGYGVLS